MNLRPESGFSGHFAQIWAILLGFGLFGRINGWTDGQMDGQMDRFPCVLHNFVPFRAAALLPLNFNHTLLKQGTGTADILLRLGC